MPRKCPECGEIVPLTTVVTDYYHKASGLPNIQLLGVTVRICAWCHYHEVVLPKVHKLYLAIARATLATGHDLTASEVAFLRKVFGWLKTDAILVTPRKPGCYALHRLHFTGEEWVSETRTFALGI